MTPHVPGQRLGDTTFFAQSFERIHTTLVVGYWKHPAVFTQSTVFFHNLLGIVKQLDVGFSSRLLSMDYYPLAIVKERFDVLFLQVIKIYEGKTSETTEQKQITYHAHFLSGDWYFHEQANLFFCQELPCRLFFLVLISSERVFYKPLIIYGAEYHCTEIADKHHRRVYLQVLFGSEKSLVVRDKRQRQLFQSNILHMIMRLQELTDIGTSYSVSCE